MPAIRKYPRILILRCKHCGIGFSASQASIYKAASTGVQPQFCRQACHLKHMNTPERQKIVANKGAHKIRQWQLDNKSRAKKTYVKYYGRHEHRIVAEKLLGRPLRKGEVVHHIDGNPHNNFPSNLFPCTRKRHVRIHQRGGKFV